MIVYALFCDDGDGATWSSHELEGLFYTHRAAFHAQVAAEEDTTSPWITYSIEEWVVE